MWKAIRASSRPLCAHSNARFASTAPRLVLRAQDSSRTPAEATRAQSQMRFMATEAKPATTTQSTSNAPKKVLLETENFVMTLHDNIAVIGMDVPNSKMNVLNEQVMEDFTAVFDEIESNSAIKAAVLVSNKPGSFIAGADIKMLDKVHTAQDGVRVSTNGQNCCNRIEDCSKPVVAAIGGACLGGGLEVALACHYRIALDNPKTVLGLPEVMLGILPGAGGTFRLPRIPGLTLPDVYDLILTGKSLQVAKAKKLGIIDGVVNTLGPGVASVEKGTIDYLTESGVLTAKALVAGQLQGKRLSDYKKPATWKEWAFSKDTAIQYVTKKALEKVSRPPLDNFPAPPKIIDCVQSTLTTDDKERARATSLQKEAEHFGSLVVSPECKTFIGIINGLTECKKNHFGKPQKKTEVVGIIGAGLMGAGIAQVTVDKGIQTTLKDVSDRGLAKGYNDVYKGFDGKVKRKRLTTFKRDATMAKLGLTTDWDGFRNADVVIEAVFEELSLKHRILQDVEQNTSEHCVFASNTSALPISQIASVSKRPEKVVGMHYFSPVDKMLLLEIITTDKTSKDTAATAVQLGLKQGKAVIVVKDGPGFYTTRILAPFMSESLRLLQEGVAIDKLDKLSKVMGLPVGCITLMDEVGIDVAMHVSEDLGNVFKERFEGGNPQLLKDMVANNCLGRKSGKGFHVFPTGKGAKKTVNPEAVMAISGYSAKSKGELTNENIKDRLLLRFVNEALYCLQEDILRNPIEGDIGAVFGLGFPPFLGGPFRYVDMKGASNVVERLQHFEQQYGASFKPAQILLDYAQNGKKFHK